MQGGTDRLVVACPMILHASIMIVPPAVAETVGVERTRALSRHARVALGESARLCGVEIGKLEKGPRGRPLPSGGVHWSLSHTNSYVAAVTAPHPVGIDIEAIKAFTSAVQMRVATADEWAIAGQISDDVFCRYWTAKEAVLKAVGIGLGGLFDCVVTGVPDRFHVIVQYKGAAWTVSQFRPTPDHIAAVTVPADCVAWHVAD